MIRRAIVFFALILAALGLAPAAGADTSGTLVITTNTKLGANHDGNIIIAADNVTLDCAGHTVTGAGVGYGILIQDQVGVT